MDESATSTELAVTNLCIALATKTSCVEVVSDMSFALRHGDCLGIIGESGSGKTLTLRALAGILPTGTRVLRGTVSTTKNATTSSSVAELRSTRHRRGLPPPIAGEAVGLAMVFQEPRSALNPTMRVGRLVAATLRRHHGLSRREARRRMEQLLAEVGIPDPHLRARAWPHELSGGMCQRVMLAAALATEPRVLLCDEPTTALDVTIQDQILGLIDGLRVNRGLSVVFVSHDLEVVAQISERVLVMYAGRVMESGLTRDVFRNPRHPYTAALLRSLPSASVGREPLDSIPGSPPTPAEFPAGCRFAPRCPHASEACRTIDGALHPAGDQRMTACIRAGEIFGAEDA